MTALYVVASKTGWSLTELKALPNSELHYYLKLIAKAHD